jgi:histidyl-tRNA synthetase
MPQSKREGYYIGAMDEEAVDLVVSLTQKKRLTEKAICDFKAKNLKSHLKGADKANAKYCCIIGSDELKNSTIWVKNLENKTESNITIREF